ncbi:hypothetical protein H9P43_009942 [Blastocladiella emersonii ATCC 22665]|nr:hypothetical protein H9P43_009942 [Blastocladiella emersonii ATCC 22665]
MKQHSTRASSSPLVALVAAAAVAVVLLATAPAPADAARDLDAFYALLAKATHDHPDVTGPALAKRALLARDSTDPRACPPSFNVFAAPASVRTQRRNHLIAFAEGDKCAFPDVEAQLPALLATLDGKVLRKFNLINAYAVNFPQDLPVCELYHLPCVKYIEEDMQIDVRQVSRPPPAAVASSSSAAAARATSSAAPRAAPAATATPAPAAGAGSSASRNPTGAAVGAAVVGGAAAGAGAVAVANSGSSSSSSNAGSSSPMADAGGVPGKPTMARLPTNDNLNLWGLDVIDGLKDKNYTFEYTGKTAHVYVIDSGIEFRHPDFEGRADLIWQAPNLDTKGFADCSGHGSHVSSIVASKSVGVAKEAKVHMIRVIGCSEKANNQDIINALDDLSKTIKKPAVINMSLGPGKDKDTGKFPRSEALINMLNQYTQKMQIPIVLAAGNDESGECTPMAEEVKDIIVVGAVSEIADPAIPKFFPRATFSNYGCITTYAPGSNIWGHSNITSGGYAVKQGTSQAAPFISGMIAQLFDKYDGKQLTPAQAKDLLLAYSTPQVREVPSDPESKAKPFAHTPISPATRDLADKALKSQQTTQGQFGLYSIAFGVIGAIVLTCVGFCCIRRHGRRSAGPKVIGGLPPGLGPLEKAELDKEHGFRSTPATATRSAAALGLGPHRMVETPNNRPVLVPLANGNLASSPAPAAPRSPDSLYFPPQRSMNGAQIGFRNDHQGPPPPMPASPMYTARPAYPQQQHPQHQYGGGPPAGPPGGYGNNGGYGGAGSPYGNGGPPYGGGRQSPPSPGGPGGPRGYAPQHHPSQQQYGGGGGPAPPSSSYQPRGPPAFGPDRSDRAGGFPERGGGFPPRAGGY